MSESHNIEYKSNWRDEYLKWISGFANVNGGKLLLGVDDCFSIWNDGGLPEGLTEEDLKKVHSSKPRSPLIADVCFKGGYIDLWGRGTIKIIEACLEAVLPEPVLKEEQGGFLSKIFKDRFTEDQLRKMGLNERQIKAV